MSDKETLGGRTPSDRHETASGARGSLALGVGFAAHLLPKPGVAAKAVPSSQCYGYGIARAGAGSKSQIKILSRSGEYLSAPAAEN
jgi:hypothetical protein